MLARIYLGRFASPFIVLWQGGQPLPIAFWLFLVFGSFLALILSMLAAVPFILFGQHQAAIPLVIAMRIVYPMVAAVGVWRSANRRPFNRWPVAAAAAKIGVVFWMSAIAAQVTGIRDLSTLLRLIH